MKKGNQVAPPKADTQDKPGDKPVAPAPVAADKPADPPADVATDEKAAKKPKADAFRAVFESNPQADEIYVVDGMPFLEHAHALNHARGDKAKVQTVKR